MFVEDLGYIYTQRYIHTYASMCKQKVKEANKDIIQTSPNNSGSSFSYNLKKACQRGLKTIIVAKDVQERDRKWKK